MQFEILAPAGSMESLIAGVRCGAHAVYLGGQTFNARRGAGNFSPQELQAAVQYCHTRGVKVYMTLNTLVSDSELPGAVAAAGNALDAGVDAFIVQDLGLAAALAAVYPGVHLHASTQCSVTTPAGFQALEKMGFRRAVIPREMTAAEIEEIRRRRCARDSGRAVCARRALYVRQRAVLSVLYTGRPQRQPGPLRPTLPPALLRRRQRQLRFELEGSKPGSPLEKNR